MVFSVSCPECHASFPVDGEKVPESGVRARCSECEGVFYVQHPEVSEVQETQSSEIQSAVEAPEAEATEAPEAVATEEAAVEATQDATEEAAEDDDAFGVTAAADPDGDEAIEAVAGDGQQIEQGMQAVGAEPLGEVAVQEPPGAAFGKADPEARAARLARVLVSDMMTYNPKLYEQAQEQGTLAADFEDEVKKSWSEYVDQVGEDIAHGTSHFMTALNDILAKGEAIFDQTMYR